MVYSLIDSLKKKKKKKKYHGNGFVFIKRLIKSTVLALLHLVANGQKVSSLLPHRSNNACAMAKSPCWTCLALFVVSEAQKKSMSGLCCVHPRHNEVPIMPQHPWYRSLVWELSERMQEEKVPDVYTRGSTLEIDS